MASKEQVENLYHAVNRMMMRLGADGEIDATSTEAGEVMAALATIDGGVYDDKFKSAQPELIKTLDHIIGDYVAAMQAAWIEWRVSGDGGAAMKWIGNTLFGPGLIPDEDAPFSDNPQAWFDANKSEPFPYCWCGMPSNILSQGKGFCCEQHCAQGESIFKIQTREEEPVQ